MSKPDINEATVQAAFERVLEPSLNWNLIALNLVKRIEVSGRDLEVDVNLVTRELELIDQFRIDVDALVTERLRPDSFKLRIRAVDVTSEGVSAVKQIILVGSGKGGVGKSSIAMNLAGGLSKRGYRVGLMDADVHGPSAPIMLGVNERPEALPDEYLMPVMAHGMKTMSIGYIIDERRAIDWRGALASGTLLQFIQRTFWGELDYLVIDLPPGTGDIQLTLAKRLECAGVVIVTTPQEVVLGDVRRSINMFEKRDVPILGLVENMSYMTCPGCGHEHSPFPRSERVIEEDPMSEVPLLAQVPLSIEVSRAADAGCPIVLREDSGLFGDLFMGLAEKVSERAQESMERLAERRALLMEELRAARDERSSRQAG